MKQPLITNKSSKYYLYYNVSIANLRKPFCPVLMEPCPANLTCPDGWTNCSSESVKLNADLRDLVNANVGDQCDFYIYNYGSPSVYYV